MKITVTTPPAEDFIREGWMCAMCATRRPHAFMVHGPRASLVVCHECAKALVAGIIDASVAS